MRRRIGRGGDGVHGRHHGWHVGEEATVGIVASSGVVVGVHHHGGHLLRCGSVGWWGLLLLMGWCWGVVGHDDVGRLGLT